MTRHLAFTFTLCWLAATINLSATAAVRTVALSGQPAPGANAGENFGQFGFNDQFHGLSINADGRVAFRGNLTNTGIANHGGIWSEGGGSLSLVARETNVAPGTEPGTVFGSFFATPILNDNGQTAFYGQIRGRGVSGLNELGFWRLVNGQLELATRNGNPAPDSANNANFFQIFTPVQFNNAGQIAFSAVLTGSTGVDFGNYNGVWSEGGGAPLGRLAYSGDAAPGTSAGVNFGSSDPFAPSPPPFQPPLLNRLGQVAFVAELIGSGVDGKNNFGIWKSDSGSLALVARTGSSAVGAGSGANFHSFAHLSLNSNGKVAFAAAVTAGGGGIWKQTESGLELFVSSADQAADANSGETHAGFGTLGFNSNNHLAFVGTIAGAGVTDQYDDAVWSEGNGGHLRLIGREGIAAPGTTAKFGRGGIDTRSPFQSLVFNDLGQAGFGSFLRGPGVDSSNDFGIWAEDLTGSLQLIVREGDFIDVNDDPQLSDMRQIAELRFFSNPNSEGGEGTLFNNRGQLAFTARFTDGTSGIFVSDAVAVPEPASFILVFFASALLLRRR